MANSTLEIIAKHKFIYLLLSLLLLLLIHPLLYEFVPTRIVMHVFFSIVLLSTIYAVSQKGAMRIVAISLLLPALVGTWIGYVTDHSILHLANMGFTGVFFAFTGILIASEVFQEEKVTVDTISGAICVYLLIGMTWAELYSMTEFIEPGSFSIQRYLLQTSGYQPELQSPLTFRPEG